MSLTFTEALGSAPWRLRETHLEKDKNVLKRYCALLLCIKGTAEFAVASSRDQITDKWRCVLTFSLWSADGEPLQVTMQKTGKTWSSAKHKVMHDALDAVKYTYDMMEYSVQQIYAGMAINFYAKNLRDTLLMSVSDEERTERILDAKNFSAVHRLAQFHHLLHGHLPFSWHNMPSRMPVYLFSFDGCRATVCTLSFAPLGLREVYLDVNLSDSIGDAYEAAARGVLKLVMIDANMSVLTRRPSQPIEYIAPVQPSSPSTASLPSATTDTDTDGNSYGERHHIRVANE
jgi:hypothetical protein